MCFKQSKIIGINAWNWDGDHILFRPILKSGRPTIASPHKQYPMDVREYVATENNALIRQTLDRDVSAFMRRQGMNKALFKNRVKGAFDYKAHVLTSFVSDTIQYKTRNGRDPWQYPEETLALHTGDCEDIAFVLASLLLAAGISPYNLRVALGNVVAHSQSGAQTYDHMWVMYKAESGHWHLLEPLHGIECVPNSKDMDSPRPEPDSSTQVQYRPRFLFNGDHVWMVKTPDHTGNFEQAVNKSWNRINPKFAGFVHQNIINSALKDVAPPAMLQSLNRHFSFGWTNGLIPTIEDVDNFVTNGYDSRDHFDNGYIEEGWSRVQARLAAFARNNTDFDSFALAAHGISDFYAHSSYGHFAALNGNHFEIYDHDNLGSLRMKYPEYSAKSGFDLSSAGLFSPNKKVFKGNRDAIPEIWKGKLISGRYAQPGDSKTLLEAPTFIPSCLINSPDFPQRGSLPHHNTIAVDQEKREKTHLLYNGDDTDVNDRMSYSNQFQWRFQTAVEHIRAAYQKNTANSKPNS